MASGDQSQLLTELDLAAAYELAQDAKRAAVAASELIIGMINAGAFNRADLNLAVGHLANATTAAHAARECLDRG